MRCEYEILQKFRKMPKEIQIVCVGTTQAHFALDFTDSSVNGFNMALYLNPIIFNRLLLEKYQSRIKKNAVVLITLQYPILCINNTEMIAKRNAVQYAKILPGRNPYISILGQLCFLFYPLYFDRQMRNFSALKSVWEKNRYVNHYKPWELEHLCENLFKYGWEEEIGITGYVKEGHKKALPKADKAMKKAVLQTINLISYCRKKEWRPILIGLPYSNFLNQYIPDSFKNKCFYRNVHYIQEKTLCEFLDYSADERMQDINNYMDIWFLNERGRKKFTKIVIEDLSLGMNLEI